MSMAAGLLDLRRQLLDAILSLRRHLPALLEGLQGSGLQGLGPWA